MPNMKAALYDRYGGPEVLYEGTVPLPVRKNGEILLRVHAAGVNSIDTMVRAGKLRLFTGWKAPHRTCVDFAGEVVAVPAMMSDLRVGDRVWGALPRGQWGSAAEFVSVPEECVALTPKGMSCEVAAALPTVGATALIALRDVANLRRGERLLIRGASGGVGISAVQIGKAFDADVTGLASAANLSFIRALGADRALDYATCVPVSLGRFDVILDTVGTALPAYRRLLAPGGRMVTVAIDSHAPVSALLYIAASTVFGSRRVRFFGAKASARILNDLSLLVEKCALRPVVNQVHLLPEASAAHRAVENGGRCGKQIIKLS